MSDADLPPPLAPDSAPPERYCDLVLTGGVASGVVYPWALLEIARAFCFRSIGGTSVGAMAAALAAAAEYGRRHGSLAGFELLRRMPGALAEQDGSSATRLLRLFVPQPGSARLFTLFLGVLRRNAQDRKRGLGPRMLALLAHALVVYLGPALLLPLLAFVAVPTLGTAAAAAIAAQVSVVLLCAAGWRVWRDLSVELVANEYGACKGRELVAWLHEGVQAAAGKPLDAPLRFAELHAAPGFPPRWMDPPPAAGSAAARSIDLQVITTNLTHGRPYRLPLEPSETRLFFKHSELADYLPAVVLAELERVAPAYVPRDARDPAEAAHGGERLRQLPTDDLPIVVAARLSLSFPFLFSAVPLWAIDDEPQAGPRPFGRCLFSDGGICSNFPIHLFDAALPAWPTFGIFLGQRGLRAPVWLPQTHLQGREDDWQRPNDDDPAASPIGRFVGMLVTSAKDWNDRSAMRLPGVRDRVVRIGLAPGEGELNIAMSGRSILRMARDYGTPAGREVVARYTDPQQTPRLGAGWDEHRWVRWQTLLSGVRERLRHLRRASRQPPQSAKLRDQIDQSFLARPLSAPEGESDPSGAALGAGQADALQRALDALETLEASLQDCDVPQPYRPQPEPALRLRPPV